MTAGDTSLRPNEHRDLANDRKVRHPLDMTLQKFRKGCPIFCRRPGPVSRVQVRLPRVWVCNRRRHLNIYTGIGRIA
jgi:hypothetical protein